MGVFECPHCRLPLTIGEHQRGQNLSCPFCHRPFTAPAVVRPRVTAVAVGASPFASGNPPQGKRSFLDRFVTGVSGLLERNREERIANQAEGLYRELARLRDHFDYEVAAVVLEIQNGDSQLVRERVYRRLVDGFWKDGLLSQQEQRTLTAAAGKLHLSKAQAGQLNWEVAQKVFGNLLATAIEDGHLDEREAASLNEFAASLGTTVTNLMQGFFKEQGEQLLRAVFAGMTQDGRIADTEWRRLLETAHRLGFSQQQLLEAVEGQSRLFVEHVLADAKSDGLLTEQEERFLGWLLQQLVLPENFRFYVASEIDQMRLLRDIASGRLPTVKSRVSMELKAGEIPHFLARVTYCVVKQTRYGPRVDQFEGEALITDTRLTFSSHERSFSVNHRNVVQADFQYNGVEVRTSGKGAGLYNFGSQNQLAFAILRTAIGKANQTIVDASAGLPTRHIPRDIRQRVWQKFGGRCAECASEQYLEFDHVIPVAKGGSNSEANVQLLCRGCNLKKSDHI